MTASLVVIGQIQGPALGMAAIDRIGQLEARRHFYLLTAILGKFYAQLGHCEAAQNHWQFALGLAPSRAERDLLEKRQENLVMGPSAGIPPGATKLCRQVGPLSIMRPRHE